MVSLSFIALLVQGLFVITNPAISTHFVRLITFLSSQYCVIMYPVHHMSSPQTLSLAIKESYLGLTDQFTC